MSSTGWGKLFAQSGIFGDDQSVNPWANANLVFIKYCSSDSWFGDAPASEATYGFAFRGSRIVSATITALAQENGLGSSGGQERLLFSGCSAGGRGALVNLDAVAAQAPANVQVQGMLDAAAWVDVQPIIPNMLSLQQMTQYLYGFTAPPIPADCSAHYTGGDAWMCLWPSYRLPFLRTNYFLNAAQFDAFQIMYDTNNLDSEYCCETPAEQQWVEQFQTSTLSLIGALPPTVPIFSSVCLVHCLSCNADFWTFTADGRSLAQAMNEWYFQGQGAVQSSIVGHCTGWNCTLQCSGGPWEPTNTPCPTTTNVCANDYFAMPSPPGKQPSGTTPSDIAAWNAHNAATNPQSQSQFAATNYASSPRPQAAGNPVGVVGDSEPALTSAQQAVLTNSATPSKCQQQAAMQMQAAQQAAQNGNEQGAAQARSLVALGGLLPGVAYKA